VASAASVLTRKFVDKVPLWEPDRASATLGAQYLSPGREPWVRAPSQRPALQERGRGEGGYRQPTAGAVIDGAEFFNELLSRDSSAKWLDQPRVTGAVTPDG